MKKIGILLFAIGFVVAANAQTPIDFGLKFGYNSAKLRTDNISEISFKNGDTYNLGDVKDDVSNGFQLGAFLRINLGKWYLQPEAYVASKGGETRFEDFNTGDATIDFVQKQKLTTFDVPILLGTKLIDLKVANVRLNAGPVASFIMSENITLGNLGSAYDDIKNNFQGENYKSAIWSGLVGAGVDVWKLTLDVRYEFGINDISELDFEKRSNMLNISLGFKII